MSKRGENIYKRKDSRWEGRYLQERKEDGSIRYGYVYGKTYQETKQNLLEAQLQNAAYRILVQGSIRDKSVPNLLLFPTVAREWLIYKENCVKASTLAKYKQITESHLIPKLFQYSILDIELHTVHSVLLELHQDMDGLSQKSILCIYTILKSILKYSSLEYHTPMPFLTPPVLENDSAEILLLSVDQQHLLEAYLCTPPFTHSKAGVLIALYTGIRIGELCALTWKDIDFTSRILHIRHTIQRISIYSEEKKAGTKIILDSPKSKTSIRDIPLPKKLESLLLSLYTEDSFENSKDSTLDKYLLTGTAKYMEPRCYSYHWQQHLKRLGLPSVRFHSLRHLFATRCIEADCDVKTLCEIMGHSNIYVTLQYYSHSRMESKRKLMDSLEYYL